MPKQGFCFIQKLQSRDGISPRKAMHHSTAPRMKNDNTIIPYNYPLIGSIIPIESIK